MARKAWFSLLFAVGLEVSPKLQYSLFVYFIVERITNTALYAKSHKRNNVHKLGNHRNNRKWFAAAKKMKDKRISSLLVIDKKRNREEKLL